MPEQKTKPSDASVESYIAAIEDPVRRQDCLTLLALMQEVTGVQPRLWGTSMVGFGAYHYKYASGHEGDSFLTGFASRKSDLTLYLYAGLEQQGDLLAQLGKHKAGKGCLYLKRLADVDLKVLKELVERSVRLLRVRYGPKKG